MAVLGLRDIRGLLLDQRIVAHSNEVIESLDGLLLTMDDAETGQRGYVLTGSDEFLGPYRGVDKRASNFISELKILVSDNPVQTAALDSTARFVAREIRLMQETIDLRRASGLALAVAFVSTGRGKAGMDSVRAKIKVMKQRERGLLKARSDREQRGLNTAELVGILGVVAAALMAFFAASLIRRTTAMRRRDRHTASRIRTLTEGRDTSERSNVAKTEFLTRMSHELRTPLNSVIGFANVLLRNKAGNLRPEDVDYLDRIQKNGIRLLELIDDILDLSKIEAGRMDVDAEQVDVGELARDVAAEFDTQIAARSLELSVDAPSGMVPVTTDRVKLRQVLLNLVGNAIKFTERGTVRISVICVDHGRVPSRIEVADSGIGIPPDRISAIFDPFEQAEKSTTRKYGGTGLGLPISRSLCVLLGFDLRVDSSLGSGSTFIVDLAPAARRRKHHAAVAPTAAVVPKPIDANVLASALLHEIGTGKVLIVDDDPDTLKLLTEYAYEEGAAEVLAAAGGAEALDAVDNFSPDLILLDILMPNVDGAAVLAALDDHPRRDEFPVVIVSSTEPSRVEAFGVRVPIIAVLRKGRNLESELRSILRGYLSAVRPTKNSGRQA